MAEMLNIARADAEPFYVDPEKITAIHIAQDNIRVSGAAGEMFSINADYRGVDLEDMLQKMRDSGNPMLGFPVRYEGGMEYPCYISPRAVTYLSVLGHTASGNVKVLAGVKGVNRIETATAGMTQKEYTDIHDAVLAAKDMLDLKSLCIDPRAVAQIVDCGDRLTFSFDQTGDVNIIVKRPPVLGDNPRDTENMSPEEYNRMLSAYPKAVAEAQARAHFNFAAGIVSYEQNRLVNLSTADRVNYIRKKDISHVSFYDAPERGDYYLSVFPRKDLPDRTNLVVIFDSAAERQAAFDMLQNAPAEEPEYPGKSVVKKYKW